MVHGLRGDAGREGAMLWTEVTNMFGELSPDIL